MKTRHSLGLVVAAPALAMACFAGCGGSKQTAPAPSPAAKPAPPVQATPEPAAPEEPEPAPEATPLPPGMAPIAEPWKGDLDGMVKRRLIRVLTVASPVLYFVDKGRELGITYEGAKAFEKSLNESLGNKVVTVNVVMVPVARDELLPRLLAGKGDIVAATLTITPERRKQVEFSDPFAKDVKEVLVTAPDAPVPSSLEDLAGQEIHVRASSSYAEHLGELNARLAAEGKAPVKIVKVDEVLEDGDILEMVNAGLLPATVVDDYQADLWAKVFDSIHVHPEIVLNSGGEIAWAFRKDSPKLAAAVNAHVKAHKQGTTAGNVAINKYLKSAKWVKNARGGNDIKRFQTMADLFKKYGDQYSFDWLLMAAQGYQESQLDQSRRSRVGAIGVMQVMPATARDKSVNIPDIQKLENNIHAGIKYNRWMVDNFYQEPGIKPVDRQLFAFASYNAGPGSVSRLRKEAKAQGLDPNRWFNNVELVAARRIGRETVQYVANIYKYYLAYQLIYQQNQARAQAKGRS